jgi:superfamily II helicase
LTLLTAIGGIGTALASALAGFAIYFLILFLVDLVAIIRRKYRNQKRTYTLLLLGGRLKTNKIVILSQIQQAKDF